VIVELLPRSGGSVPETVNSSGPDRLLSSYAQQPRLAPPVHRPRVASSLRILSRAPRAEPSDTLLPLSPPRSSTRNPESGRNDIQNYACFGILDHSKPISRPLHQRFSPIRFSSPSRRTAFRPMIRISAPRRRAKNALHYGTRTNEQAQVDWAHFGQLVAFLGPGLGVRGRMGLSFSDLPDFLRRRTSQAPHGAHKNQIFQG
jgi:hypothetical protein